MEEYHVRIKSIELITHDVVQIVLNKPAGIQFTPGQAADISIAKPGWEKELRPFTFTSLPEYDYLQFTIKTYPDRKGVTNQLLLLKKDDELILHEIFGAISYREEGVFIAGGAGITPFICIFRNLKAKNKIGSNKLIFANKTKDDIILKHEFGYMLADNFINILSEEITGKYAYGYLTEKFLSGYITSHTKNIYLCGPPPMMEAVEKMLAGLHVDPGILVQEAV